MLFIAIILLIIVVVTCNTGSFNCWYNWVNLFQKSIFVFKLVDKVLSLKLSFGEVNGQFYCGEFHFTAMGQMTVKLTIHLHIW